jgi:hypothetical protein
MKRILFFSLFLAGCYPMSAQQSHTPTHFGDTPEEKHILDIPYVKECLSQEAYYIAQANNHLCLTCQINGIDTMPFAISTFTLGIVSNKLLMLSYMTMMSTREFAPQYFDKWKAQTLSIAQKLKDERNDAMNKAMISSNANMDVSAQVMLVEAANNCSYDLSTNDIATHNEMANTYIRWANSYSEDHHSPMINEDELRERANAIINPFIASLLGDKEK